MNRFLRKFNLLQSNEPKSTGLRVDRRFRSLSRLIYPIKTTFLRQSEAVQLFTRSATQSATPAAISSHTFRIHLVSPYVVSITSHVVAHPDQDGCCSLKSRNTPPHITRLNHYRIYLLRLHPSDLPPRSLEQPQYPLDRASPNNSLSWEPQARRPRRARVST